MAKDESKDNNSEGVSKEEVQPKPTTLLLVRHALNDWVGENKLAVSPPL